MTEFEIKKLRQLFEKELAKVSEANNNFLIETDRPLDEDSGQFYLSIAEEQAFGIDRDYFHALQLAYMGYEAFIGVCEGQLHTSIDSLIIKAREICPPARWYEHEQSFQLWNQRLLKLREPN